jgi:hypothetical protein
MSKPRFKSIELSTVRRFRGTISASDLRKAFRIPAGASITFTVPTGGDYSGQNLDLEDGYALIVEWEELKRT